jgi:DNA processing protein
MEPSIDTIPGENHPKLLQEISDPPEALYKRGSLPDTDTYTYLCVVGSRKYTSYGKKAIEKIIRELSGYPVAVVSGMAFGIDSIAHKAAIDADLPTVAVPGSGLNEDVLYPRSHVSLAKDILSAGGALVSEFEPDFEAAPWAFPKRNRIMAGLCEATLIVQATKESGTLITARLAADYHRDIFTIPGSIFADSTDGNHMLLKKGAALIRNGKDVARELHVKKQSSTHEDDTANLSDDEQAVIDELTEPIPRDDLIRALDIKTAKANGLLAEMEIDGLIHEEGGKIHSRI